MGCDTSRPSGNDTRSSASESGVVVIGRNRDLQKKDGIGSDVGHFKIVVLGDVAVGKTSILRQFMNGTFDAEHEPTVPASFQKVVVDLGPDQNNREVTLSVWDTAGQERFHQVFAGLGEVVLCVSGHCCCFSDFL